MMNGQVGGLGVVVSPRSEHVVPLSLAGAPVRLDLDSPDLEGCDVNHSLCISA